MRVETIVMCLCALAVASILSNDPQGIVSTEMTQPITLDLKIVCVPIQEEPEGMLEYPVETIEVISL